MKSSQALYGRREQRKSASVSDDVDRQEFTDADDGWDRNPNEHPEQAYRRGFQQGAHAVLEPLIKAKLLDERTEKKLRNFVYWRVYEWRYARRRRLSRHVIKDPAPRLE